MGCVSGKKGKQPEKAVILTHGAGSDERDNIQFSNFIAENTKDPKSYYKYGKQLGEGSYGIVFKVQHKQTRETRAMKKIPKESLTREEQKQKLVNDILILRSLDHPNIIKVYEFYQDASNFYVVSEYCGGGELFERVEKLHSLSEREAANAIKQVLEQIAHRDLKPENIMLDIVEGKGGGQANLSSGDYQVKVIDWGCSGIFEPGKYMNAYVGTPYYIAPEVLKKQYTEKADIWSIGAILYQLLCGDPLFNGETMEEVLDKVENSKNWDFPKNSLWNDISDDAKDIIKKMMTFDPVKRLSAKEALSHNWIKNAPTKPISSEQRKQCIDKMRQFRGRNKFQNAVLSFITSQLIDKKEKSELIQAFKAIDKDGNGTLTRDEIQKYYQDIMTEDEIKEMMLNIDANDNGQVNYTEFVNATLDKNKSISQDKLKQAFDFFDSDGNGYITADEIKKIIGQDMKEKDETQWTELMTKADTNHDGKISFEEFSNMMISMIK